MKKNCQSCNKEIDLPEDKQYMKYCAECYRKVKEQPKDPYEAGKDEGKLSPVECGMLFNRSVDIAIHGESKDIVKNFEALKEKFLELREMHQKCNK